MQSLLEQKVLDLVRDWKNRSFAFQTKDSPRNERYLKMSTSASGIKKLRFLTEKCKSIK